MCGWRLTGRVAQLSHDLPPEASVLVGLPIFDELHGPIWEPTVVGGPAIDYETQEVYAILTWDEPRH
jgi:hypothetical protein